MSIEEKLLKIQSELKAPKSQYNSFGKYNYRSCEDILEAVKPLCIKNKAVVTIMDELVMLGTRYYIKATAALFDAESDGVITVCAYAREEESKKGMDASQVTGSASSYARKYALNGLFAIDDTKDSDAQTPAQKKLEYKCADCGKVFEEYTGKNGKSYTAAEVFASAAAANADGKARCKACKKKFMNSTEGTKNEQSDTDGTSDA